MSCPRNLLSLFTLAALTAIGPAHGAEPTQVKVETTSGDFVVQLDADRAPLSVANFLEYVRNGFYDGTIFHRVVNGFEIWWVTLFYLVAVIALGFHIWHGFWSAFATLGANTSLQRRRTLNTGAAVIALVIALGFMTPPLAILFGLVGQQ